ncbi:hypothetical protein LV89_00825 [Arcicella aurantiaca]|uniref:Uncharacterized protein n=1 Tax=Arcicella aurantiaca TaxID=591202 RepID=A0A316EEJ5_9BACT|nr:hypothetical protein [Arcicella aurantiaca]PWK28621.1 hypothetical protein LV89_00825 [Arcicella aurantiaca]
MLIQRIQEDPILSKFLCDDCTENGVGVNVSPLVKKEDYIIIRVDEYYNSNLVHNPPKSPDCLIIQHCEGEKFVLYLVELKAIETLKTEKLSDIRDKFQNCFDDFMSDRFRDYFYDIAYEFSIKLLFISNPSESKKDNKSKPTRMDSLLSQRPCKFANRPYLLEHRLPNPVIQPCQ